MSPVLIGLTVTAAVLASLFFSTLTYALRDFSRAKLEGYLESHGKTAWFERTVDHRDDLIFVTAACRLLANMMVLLGMLRAFNSPAHSLRAEYFLAAISTLLLTIVVSVAVPHAVARYNGEQMIGRFVRILHLLRWLMTPINRLMKWTDDTVRNIAGTPQQTESEEIEQEIVSVVEEGVKEGVVDEQEMEMIESVIEFRDTTVGQIMTSRPEIVALEANCSLLEVKQTLEESGHSRVPVYKGTLDHIVGILYARDLLKHLGLPPEKFDIRSAIRPALYVPETKPLRDLLTEFRIQKVHIAIVLDEYGGTAGLVSIEDIIEELVGDISDEHEKLERAMLARIDDTTYEADARLYLDELNRTLGLSIAEDAGYDTLGGYLSTTLGRIPSVGTVLEQPNAKYTVLEAEPHKINRVKIELIAPSSAEEEHVNVKETA